MNHIIIGNLYLFFSFLMFIFSGLIVLGVRLELFSPGLNIMVPDFFNSLITVHGLVMIFGSIMPAFFGFFYWYFPYLTNFNEMFFESLGFLSFLILFFSIILIIFLNFLPIGFISIGWTLYSPISIQSSYNMDFIIFSIYLISISTIINSLNFTFSILRSINFCFNSISIFSLSWLVSCYLIIIAIPVLLGLVTMLFLDRYLYTSFFNPFFGGDVLVYQHIFWFFGHPEVYIIILPSFAIISQILPIFSKKKIFGYKSIFFSIISIGFFSLITWGHHMFVTGMPLFGQIFFMYCTMFISIPTGIKVFNWLFTIWESRIVFETPMLFSLGFIFFFIIGGFSGFLLSISPINIYYHGTYFVVAHFHYILVSSSIFSIFSFWYYFSPFVIGVRYNNFYSKIHFWWSLIFINMIFFPMHFLGNKCMPRRYIDYPLKYIFYNRFITLNLLFFFVFQVLFIYYIFMPLVL